MASVSDTKYYPVGPLERVVSMLENKPGGVDFNDPDQVAELKGTLSVMKWSFIEVLERNIPSDGVRFFHPSLLLKIIDKASDAEGHLTQASALRCFEQLKACLATYYAGLPKDLACIITKMQ